MGLPAGQLCPGRGDGREGAVSGTRGGLPGLLVLPLPPSKSGAESPDLDVLWPLRTFHKWPVCPLRESLGAGGTFTPEPV